MLFSYLFFFFNHFFSWPLFSARFIEIFYQYANGGSSEISIMEAGEVSYCYQSTFSI